MVGVFKTSEAEGVKSEDAAATETADAAASETADADGDTGAVPAGMADPSSQAQSGLHAQTPHIY